MLVVAGCAKDGAAAEREQDAECRTLTFRLAAARVVVRQVVAKLASAGGEALLEFGAQEQRLYQDLQVLECLRTGEVQRSGQQAGQQQRAKRALYYSCVAW